MKKRLSIPLLLCCALLVYALVSEPPQIADPEPTASEVIPPESYAFDVIVRDYDDEGRLRDQTDAEALRRFPNKAAVELDRLRATRHSATGPWVADADRGLLNERRERLDLQGNVKLVYETDGVHFASDAMILNMRDNTARSAAPVRSWQGGNETRADKLFVNLDRQTATLEGSVVTSYEPEN